jgi:hypothetical protein
VLVVVLVIATVPGLGSLRSRFARAQTGGLAVAGVLMTRAGLAPDLVARRMIALFLITAVATNLLLLIFGGLGVGMGVLPGHASWVGSLAPALVAAVLAATSAMLVFRAVASLVPLASGLVGLAGLRHGIRLRRA